MIKFFRRIRHNLIIKNQTGKYLKYAIGEIVLVVIGILIALSINNWNQAQTNRTEEVNYYKNIQRQLDEDRNGIEGNINYNSSFLSQFISFFSIISIAYLN